MKDFIFLQLLQVMQGSAEKYWNYKGKGKGFSWHSTENRNTKIRKHMARKKILPQPRCFCSYKNRSYKEIILYLTTFIRVYEIVTTVAK